MATIRIIGIGWQEDDLTLGAVRILRAGETIVLRTGRCGCADWLNREGISFRTLDELYDQCEDFDELIDASAQTICDLAKSGPVVYCVCDLSDKTCARIIEIAGPNEVELVPGVSEGTCLLPFAGGGVCTISAADADLFEPDARINTLVKELDSAMLASDIKLKLTEKYPDELTVYVCDAKGKIIRLPLCDLDRLNQYDHRMCALIPAVHVLEKLERYDVCHLVEIMRRLRDWDGCPWDREQTHESLRTYLVEEAYEAVEAINQDDTDALYDELGDVLLQIIFHADIARQYGEFELSDVTTAICKKMIRRHPHVFGSVEADTPEAVSALWSDIKEREQSVKNGVDAMKQVAGSLPALMRAGKVLKRARKHYEVVFSFNDAMNNWLKTPNSDTLGELLLALTDEAGKHGVEPELALTEAIQRMIEKFSMN